jgi:ABC-2 type transport system permease protein
MSFLSPISALIQREITRYIRQKSRIIGGFAQPILIWLFLGSGFSASFQTSGPAASYGEYIFPGILLLLLLFSSVFSAMTLIEDRDHGFLQGVLASPVPRSAIVLGKVGGGAILAVMQSLVLLALAYFTHMPFTIDGMVAALPVIGLAAIGFAATGFAVAWSMKSTSGFHAVMMIVLMPAWMLSGALFPVEGVPPWLSATMTFNPLSHAHTLLSQALWLGAAPDQSPIPVNSLAVFAGWIVLSLWVSLLRAKYVKSGRKISK